MTNQTETDLFGNPVETQPDLFGETPVPARRYQPKPELVRNSLRSLEKRVLEEGPDTVEDWLAGERVAFFRRQLDYFRGRLAETAPEEAEDFRARIAPLIDDLAARLGVDA